MENVDEFMTHKTIFRGQEYSETALELIETTAKLVDCTFLFNKKGKHRYFRYWSEWVGGTIFATQSNIDISQCIFENNGAHDLDYGGAIYAEQQSIISISGSIFIGNSGRYDIVYSHSCNFTVHTNEFYNNRVDYHYGDLFTLYSSNATIEQSVFENNSGGVLYFLSSTVKIKISKFYNNSVLGYGKSLSLYSSNATIEQSVFENNSGGVLYFLSSTVKIKISKFYNNSVLGYGKLLSLYSSNATIEHSVFENNIGSVLYIVSSIVKSIVKIRISVFHNNRVDYQNGDLLTLYSSNATIEHSVFENNIGFHNNNVSYGIMLRSTSSTMTIKESRFDYNFGVVVFVMNGNSTIDMSKFKQNIGSVMLSENSVVKVITSVFDNNTEAASAVIHHGMILGSSGGTIQVINGKFTNNKSPVIVAINSTIEHFNSLLIANNSAENEYAIIHLYNSELIGHDSGNAMISNNFRSLVAFNSNVTLKGNVKFSHNQQSQTTIGNYLQEGGALTLVQSNSILDGKCSFEYNHAENGGAIFSIDSNIYVTGNVTIVHNTANRNGGGVYLTESDLECLNKKYICTL